MAPLRNALSLRLSEEQAIAVSERADRRGISSSEAIRELLDLGLVLDASESIGLAVTAAARALMGDTAGMANVQFGLGLEPDELAAIAADLSGAECAAIVQGAPVLMTVEQMASLR
jgi:hypothetical protein